MAGLAACVLSAELREARAQAEVQTVADRPDRGERGERPEQRGGERPRPRMPGRGYPSEEIDEVIDFMREHSPNRMKAMESLPDDTAVRRGVMAFVLARYRSLQAVKEEDAVLYEIEVKQMEVEDDLYGLLAPTRTVGDREKLRNQIRVAAKALAEQNVAERERRLDRLRESLKREEQKVTADRARIDAMAEARTNLLVQDGTSALRSGTMRHGFRPDPRDSRRDGRDDRENRNGQPADAATKPAQ